MLLGPPLRRQRSVEKRIKLLSNAQHVVAHVANEEEKLPGGGRLIAQRGIQPFEAQLAAPLFHLGQLRVAHCRSPAPLRIDFAPPGDQAKASKQDFAAVVLLRGIQHGLLEGFQ